MKNILHHALPAVIVVTIMAFLPLLTVRVVWIDILLLGTGFTGVLVITFMILRKTKKLNIREKFFKDRQNFELLVSSISDYAIFLLDINGLVVSWNKGAESIKGFSATDIIGKSTDLFYAEEDIKTGLPLGNLHRALEGGHMETEGWRLRKDRSLFFANIVYTPLYEKNHKHYGYAVVTKDITGRKKTDDAILSLNSELKERVIQKTAEGINSEGKLVTSEANYRGIMERISDGFVAIDNNWNYSYVNKKGASILQHTIKELTGKNMWEIFPLLVGQPFHKACYRAMEEQHDVHLEEYYAPLKCWVENYIYPSADGLSVFFRDITERKKAEQRRESDQSNLYALINNTTDLMWSVACDFTLITSNQAFEKMYNQLSGSGVKNGATVLGAGFSVAQLQIFKAFYERAFTGESFTAEHSGFNGDTWSEISFYPIYEGKQVTGTACFSRDITERKIAEGLLKSRLAENKVVASRMQAILDALPADIALLDDKGIIIEVNDAWRNGTQNNHFTGNTYKVGDDYMDRSKHVLDEQLKDKQELIAGLSDILHNKVKEFIHEYDCDEPAIKKCFRMVARPLLGKESAGAVIMHIDITELRRMEREKIAGKIEKQKSIARAMLQAQEKERNHIGLELHDNVSQLLAATRMKLQIAISGKEVNRTIVQECIQHVEETVVETRNLSHRMVMPRFTDSSFLLAIQGLADIYRIPSRAIQLETGGLDENIVSPGIKETLYRIAQEQLNNINKYAQASDILIQAWTNNDTVTMLVKDNGIGFNPKKKKDGIGLINIKNRSESFNGTAEIKSSPGAGCSLTINIPLQNVITPAFAEV